MFVRVVAVVGVVVVVVATYASSKGFAIKILFSTPPTEPAMEAMYCKHCLVASVLPAPDSPEMMIDCSLLNDVTP